MGRVVTGIFLITAGLIIAGSVITIAKARVDLTPATCEYNNIVNQPFVTYDLIITDERSGFVLDVRPLTCGCQVEPGVKKCYIDNTGSVSYEPDKAWIGGVVIGLAYGSAGLFAVVMGVKMIVEKDQ